MGSRRCIAILATLCIAFATPPASAGDYATNGEAAAMVQQAIAHVTEVGMDSARMEFQDCGGKYFDRDIYLVVVDKSGVRVVHGQNPKLVGKSYDNTINVDGEEVMQVAAGPGMGWVSCMFEAPITGKILQTEDRAEKARDYV